MTEYILPLVGEGTQPVATAWWLSIIADPAGAMIGFWKPKAAVTKSSGSTKIDRRILRQEAKAQGNRRGSSLQLAS